MSGATTPTSASAADAAPTTYQLLIRLGRARRLVVGRLGECFFPAGLYCYTGSAKRNLAARVARHCAPKTRLHWHIDYLLEDRYARVLATRTVPGGECTANQELGGEVVVAGFGSTDCRAGCGSHLRYVGPPTAASAVDLLQQFGEFRRR